eukprot:Tamp_12339.p2 GENE.Tamp_12339~~Tamp_12339.p2  ORF type:complete len:476 (+),score=91.44 Tamp_12339:328-1755(+)
MDEPASGEAGGGVEGAAERTSLSKGMFFVYYLAMAFFLPFLPLFLEEIGLSLTTVGVLLGVRPLLGMVSAPLWGRVADVSKRQSYVLIAIMLAAGVGRLAMLAGAQTGVRGETALAPERLYGVVAVLLLSDLFGSACDAMCDATCLSALPDASLYPSVRLWGAIGWGWLGAPLAGFLLDRSSLTHIFLVHGVLLALAAAIVASIPVQNMAREAEPARAQALLSVMVADLPSAVLYASSLVLGIGYGAIGAYAFLLLQELGDGGTFMGLSLLVGCISEVLVFVHADGIIKRYGVHQIINGSVVLMGVRQLGLAALSQPYQVLLVEVLAGPIFALGWTAGLTHSKQMAPPGQSSTMIGLFTGWKFGIGGSAGALLGALLCAGLGLRGMFMSVGLLTLGLALGMRIALGAAGNVSNVSPGRQTDDGQWHQLVEVPEVQAPPPGVQATTSVTSSVSSSIAAGQPPVASTAAPSPENIDK